MTFDLKPDVFQPVVSRIIARSDSLRGVKLKRFNNIGIEGWFKVEIVAALGAKVTSINNKGPDLTLEDQTKIEIKAATNFSKNWCVVDPLKKYGCPVLFLAGGGDQPESSIEGNDTFEIIGYEVVSDGMNTWLLGMAKPKP